MQRAKNVYGSFALFFEADQIHSTFGTDNPCLQFTDDAMRQRCSDIAGHPGHAGFMDQDAVRDDAGTAMERYLEIMEEVNDRLGLGDGFGDDSSDSDDSDEPFNPI